MKRLMLKAMAILMMGTILSACGGKGENRKLKEAATIHAAFMQQYDSTYSALQSEKAKVEELLSTTQPSNDNFKAYESMQRSIDKSLNLLKSWEEAVVGVPGMEHVHVNAPHSHDHAKDEIAANMSDAEILELQKAYQTRLNEVTKEINNLLDTIKMYQTSAK